MSDAVGVRQGAAGQAGPRAARDERHARVDAGADDRPRTRAAVCGKHDERGDHLVVREAVALVRAQLLPVGDDLCLPSVARSAAARASMCAESPETPIAALFSLLLHLDTTASRDVTRAGRMATD